MGDRDGHVVAVAAEGDAAGTVVADIPADDTLGGVVLDGFAEGREIRLGVARALGGRDGGLEAGGTGEVLAFGTPDQVGGALGLGLGLAAQAATMSATQVERARSGSVARAGVSVMMVSVDSGRSGRMTRRGRPRVTPPRH